MAVFWSLAVLMYYGASSLRQVLASQFKTLDDPLIASFPKLPVVGVQLSGAFLIGVVVFAGGMILIQRWQDRPKTADLLIETETELRKVTWPTSQEVINASLVVVVCVVALMGFLAGTDWVLAQVTNVLLFGSSS